MSFPKHSKPRKKPIKKYNFIRASAIERDGGICQLKAKGCTYISGPPHHIILKSAGGADITQNIICLCPSCHRLVHTDTKKYTPILLNKQKEHYKGLTKKNLRK